ncbi:MAG: hypothetical protein ACTSSC_10375 [Promethearchaeota archaeon]
MDDEEKMEELIDELKKDIKTKDNEIVRHLDKIEALEQEIMRLQNLIPGEASKIKIKKWSR